VTAPGDNAEATDESTERVFLVGYYGFDNLGDEAIRLAIERAAPRHGAVIIHFATRGPSGDPRAVPVRGRGVWRYLRAIRRADRVVLGGGGILKDEGLWLPIELFLTALLARLLRRPVALLAVGVGPFYRGIGRALIAATARLAAPRTVRDAESGAALTRLGVRDWVLGGDPVLTLSPPASTQARATARSAARDPGARRAVVAIRPWFLGEGDERESRRRAFRRDLGEALAALAGDGWQICLVPLHWPRDRDEARRLVDETGLADAVEVLDRRLDWDDLLALVEPADLVIAMRYHALAAAAIARRPAVALAYEPKVAALAAELEIPVLSVDDPALARRLVGAVRAPAGEPGAARAADPERLAALRDRAEAALGLALSGPRTPHGRGGDHHGDHHEAPPAS
jgi:polysaccharide pyruvyl transferase CsaB